MKKLIYGFLTLFVLLFIAIYVMLFTSFGNKIVASIIQDKAQSIAGIDLNLSRFDVSFSKVDIVADIASMAQLEINGKLKLLSLGFDLDYLLALDKEYTKKLNLKLQNDLSFGGKLVGKISDFNASGSGKLFGSNVNLNAKILNYSPLELNLKANNLKIEEILDLLSKPRYATGFVNLNADIKAKDLKADGNAILNLATKSIDYKLIEKDFNLSLPHSNLQANVLALIKDKDVIAQSDIITNYLKFNTQKTHYNMEKKNLQSDFKLNIEDLKKLENLAGVKMKGHLLLDGNASLENNALSYVNLKANGQNIALLNLPNTNLNLLAKAQNTKNKIDFSANLASTLFEIPKLEGFYNLNNQELNAKTQINFDDLGKFSAISGQNMQGKAQIQAEATLVESKIEALKADANIAGGELRANSNGQSLNLEIKTLDLAKLLAISGQEIYINGILDGNAHLNSLDFKNLSGNYDFKSSGILNQKTLSKILAKPFPANSKYDIHLQGDIKNNIADFNINLKSDLANLDSFKGKFDINKMNLQSNFKLDAYDFSKLSFLAGRKLSGKAIFNGNLNYDGSIDTSVESANLFQGSLKATLKNNILDANLNNVDFSTLMRGLDLPDYYNAKANVKADYNLLNEKGQATLNLNNGKLKKVGIVNTISNFAKKDLSNEVFHTTSAKAQINKNSVDLDLSMDSDNVKIGIKNGKINTVSSILNLPLSVLIGTVEVKGIIDGKTTSPNFKIDISGTAKSAMKQLMNDKVKEKGAKELNKFLNKLF